MRLSEAYEKGAGNEEVNLELKVTVYNISPGKNECLGKECPTMGGYVTFMSKVEEYQGKILAGSGRKSTKRERNEALQGAIREAIVYCIRHNILKEELEGRRAEVEMMAFNDWTYGDWCEDSWKEGMKRGMRKGRRRGRKEGRKEGQDSVLDLMRKGYTADQIERILADRRVG